MKKAILKNALNQLNKKTSTISFQEINKFPEPVQRYLRLVLTEGIVPTFYAEMHHGGGFKTDQNKPWFEIKGHYHYLVDKPAFYWKGKIKPLPILSISARDYYYEGKGQFKIKLNSFIPIAKSSGNEVNQASLLRFLSELTMFPSVFLTADYLKWEEIDSTAARIFIKDKGIKANGVFTFNEKGEITRFESVRARTTKSGPSFDKWGGYYEEYKKFENFMIPTYFVGVWHLTEGDFEYVKFKVESIEFNNPQ